MTEMYRDGLPDPERGREFYADTPFKRFVAWVVDVVLIGLLVLVTVPFTLGISLFFLPALWLVLSFIYRWVTLAGGSATLGMRLTAIELRNASGERLDSATAFLHTLGYTVSISIFPLQLISIVLMLTTPRAQGLTDLVLGTAALNRAARF